MIFYASTFQPDTDILLIDGMNGMGSVVHSSGPQCTPCEQTQDLKVFQALSIDDLIKWGALHGADLPCYEEERVELRRGPSGL